MFLNGFLHLRLLRPLYVIIVICLNTFDLNTITYSSIHTIMFMISSLINSFGLNSHGFSKRVIIIYQ